MKIRCVSDYDQYAVKSASKILDIQPNSLTNSYSVNVSFPSHSSYADRATGVIDSGSSNTIISMKALYDNLSDAKYNVIKNALIKANAFTKSFSSAKGKNDITASLCILPLITINGYIIKDFPFYLMDNREKSVVLIGFDFISSCDVVQSKNSNLKLYDFDINAMWLKMKSNDALKLLSVQF